MDKQKTTLDFDRETAISMGYKYLNGDEENGIFIDYEKAAYFFDMADWKDSVRIAVEKTDDMVKWKKWVEENDGDPAYMRALKKTAADNKNWYVCEREISVSEIVDIEVNGKPFNDYDQIMEFIRSLSSGLSGIRVS